MKIAICGAHAVGKSTLIGGLVSRLPGFRVIEEPYQSLLDDGFIFGDPPGVDDFEAQLERSLSMVETDGEDAIFDRSPADFFGYLSILQPRDTSGAMAEHWSAVALAMKRMDLIVYVPIERPDRIQVSASEYPRLRRRTDQALRRLLVDGELGVSEKVLEVRGSVVERRTQVLDKLSRVASTL